MAGWLLQNQPNNTKWSEILHSAHVGVTTDSHHCSGHSEWCHNEHPDGLLQQSVNHQETGPGSHGDSCLYPEHPGGESRGGAVHIFEQLQCKL